MSHATPVEIKSAFDDNAELWLDASENHAFLVGCANGTVSESQFNTWLVQDYMYVTSFHHFLSAIMQDAPVVDDEILKSGGSLSHHHGVGKLRREFLPRVLSPAALAWSNGIKQAVDPQRLRSECGPLRRMPYRA